MLPRPPPYGFARVPRVPADSHGPIAERDGLFLGNRRNANEGGSKLPDLDAEVLGEKPGEMFVHPDVAGRAVYRYTFHIITSVMVVAREAPTSLGLLLDVIISTEPAAFHSFEQKSPANAEKIYKREYLVRLWNAVSKGKIAETDSP